jgi:hypothetical protein
MASKQETLALFADASRSVDEILSLYEKFSTKLDASFGWVTQYVSDFAHTKANVQGKPASWDFAADQSTAQLYAQKAPEVLANFKKALAARKLLDENPLWLKIALSIVIVGVGAAMVSDMLPRRRF